VRVPDRAISSAVEHSLHTGLVLPCESRACTESRVLWHQSGDWHSGSAFPSHGKGHRFDPCIAHHRPPSRHAAHSFTGARRRRAASPQNIPVKTLLTLPCKQCTHEQHQWFKHSSHVNDSTKCYTNHRKWYHEAQIRASATCFQNFLDGQVRKAEWKLLHNSNTQGAGTKKERTVYDCA
jgi:hypothetical protein